MKSGYILLLSLLSMSLLIACDKEEYSTTKDTNYSGGGGGNVYICTGDGANVWHRTSNCRALDNCDGQIILTSVGQLNTNKYKRACKICY